MKVLLDATVFEHPSTGIAKVTLGLYRECVHLRPTLEVLAVHRRAMRTALSGGIKSLGRIPGLPPQIWRTLVPAAVAVSRKPDLFHFPWNGQVPMLPRRIPVVITLHDVLPLLIPGYFSTWRDEERYRSATRRDLERAAVVFTDSEYSKREILRHFTPRVEPTVLLYGPTIVSPAASQPRPVKEPYFLYAGGYHHRKGLPYLLRVFLELHRRGAIRSTLLLTGLRTPLSPEFDRLIHEGRARGAVRELGYVPDDQLASLYTNALALVYPSPYEGFGLPPLEAMSLGCPVITTRGTSLPEVCGEAAMYIEPDRDSDLAKALAGVEQSEELRSDLSRRGRERALLFSWTRAARIYLDTVDILLDSWRASQGREHR